MRFEASRTQANASGSSSSRVSPSSNRSRNSIVLAASSSSERRSMLLLERVDLAHALLHALEGAALARAQDLLENAHDDADGTNRGLANGCSVPAHGRRARPRRIADVGRRRLPRRPGQPPQRAGHRDPGRAGGGAAGAGRGGGRPRHRRLARGGAGRRRRRAAERRRDHVVLPGADDRLDEHRRAGAVDQRRRAGDRQPGRRRPALGAAVGGIGPRWSASCWPRASRSTDTPTRPPSGAASCWPWWRRSRSGCPAGAALDGGARPTRCSA